MLHCEFTLSEDFLHEALAQHGNIKVTRKLMTIVKALCLVCLLTLSALLFFWMKKIGGGFLFIGLSLLLVFSRATDRFILGRRIRKSPYWNRRIRIELEEDGVRTSSDLGTSTVRWEAFTRTVEVKNGFLLYQGPDVFNWLPLSAFSASLNRETIAAFLKSKAKKFEERA